ncbi:lytic transglycosylase domain-containing protein, partial [Dysosmobacter sp.]|uniref:lytic transglycosylase domain-containing protein n=1 Tax=Dysosmobacter sp. TaxID=2591382 RepID=UPI002A8096B7
MTTSEHNARRYSRRCRQRRIARRRNAMVTVAVLAVLATVFALGYASGCSAYKTDDEVKTSEPVMAAETVTPPAPEQSPVEPSAPPEETTEPARHRDDIVSEGRLLSYELQEVMQDCCERYEVPYALALAIAEVETHFDPDAVSATGDYGLMQINSVNHKWLLEKGLDPMTHAGNIEAGIYIISQYLQSYGEPELALMAYNCGPGGARK